MIRDVVVARIPVSGGSIVADIAGPRISAARGVIIFLHGWSLDRRMWAPQMSTFAADYLCVAIDRRGFGGSTAPPDLPLEADDVAAALEYVGASRSVVVGMSQAGRVAADFVIRYGDCAAGLVLHGALLGEGMSAAPEAEVPISRYAALARDGKLPEMRTLWRAHPLMRVSDGRPSALVDKMLAEYDARDLLAEARPYQEIALRALVAAGVPTLLITGETDSSLRRTLADELARKFSNSMRTDVAGAGHFCNLCAAADYNAALGRFLDRLFP